MSDLIVPTRRGFLTSLGSLIAAPTVIKASSLMKVVAIPDYERLILRTSPPSMAWRTIYKGVTIRMVEALLPPQHTWILRDDSIKLRFRQVASQEHCSGSDWSD